MDSLFEPLAIAIYNVRANAMFLLIGDIHALPFWFGAHKDISSSEAEFFGT